MAEEKKVASAEEQKGNYYVSEHFKEVAQNFKDAFDNKTAIYMCDRKDIHKMHAIQEIYADKEGNLKSATIPAPESIYLLQVMKDRGITDPRIVSINNQKKFQLFIKKGAKAVTITKFSKNNKPYTAKMAFVAELRANKEDKTIGAKLMQSSIEVTNHVQDNYIRNMVSYLKMRNDRGTLKADNYTLMLTDAKEAAHKNYEALKPMYEEAQRRNVAIEKSVDAKVGKNDYIVAFEQMYQKNIEKKGRSEADYYTLRDAIVDKKWDEKIAKNVFNKVSPNAVFDKIRKVPLVEVKLDAIKKGKYYNENMEKQKAATR